MLQKPDMINSRTKGNKEVDYYTINDTSQSEEKHLKARHKSIIAHKGKTENLQQDLLKKLGSRVKARL